MVFLGCFLFVFLSSSSIMYRVYIIIIKIQYKYTESEKVTDETHGIASMSHESVNTADLEIKLSYFALQVDWSVMRDA